MNKLSFIFDGIFYTKSDVKIDDKLSYHNYVLGVINGIKTSSDKQLTAILLQQDALYTYGFEITEKEGSVIENLLSLDLKGLKALECTPKFIQMHIDNVHSNTIYDEIELLKVHPKMYDFIPLKNEKNVRDYLHFLMFDLNINFHPDDLFTNYLTDDSIIDKNETKIYIGATTSNFIADLTNAAFMICGDVVYDFGFEFQQEKLAKEGIKLGTDIEEEKISNKQQIKFNLNPENKNSIEIANHILNEYVNENGNDINNLKDIDTRYIAITWYIRNEGYIDSDMSKLVSEAILNIIDNNNKDNKKITERIVDKNVEETEIGQELTGIFLNFYFAWKNLNESWNNNDNIEILENNYPFVISFNDLKINDWVLYVTAITKNDLNLFSSKYNNISLEDNLENFNNAYNEIIDYLDNNKFNDNFNDINNIINDDFYYPFDEISLDDMQSKINDWVELSIRALGMREISEVDKEETPEEWKIRKTKEHYEEYQTKLKLFLDSLPHDSINIEDVEDKYYEKSPVDKYDKIIKSDKVKVGTDEQQQLLGEILGYKEILWVKVCKSILNFTFDWDSIREEVLESHFENEKMGYVGKFSGDLTGHSIGCFKLDGITYYKEYTYDGEVNNDFF